MRACLLDSQGSHERRLVLQAVEKHIRCTGNRTRIRRFRINVEIATERDP
jgi:hypothetical protein